MVYRYFLLLILFFTPLLSNAEECLLVSTAPYRYFVKQITKELFDIELMVPPGASAHTYEPTPKQMIQATCGKIWFRLGEPFEEKAIAALKSANPELIVVDLRTNIALIAPECIHCKHHASADLHIWLSPKMAKIQATTIGKALITHFPQYRDFFEKNLLAFLTQLDKLDKELYNTLQPIQNRVIVVSHPAYAYFCREYNFKQLSIEFEGKDPTPKQLTELLENVKSIHPKAIFTQPQYSDKAASLIANQIGAKLISVDPYSEDYINAMTKIAELILKFS